MAPVSLARAAIVENIKLRKITGARGKLECVDKKAAPIPDRIAYWPRAKSKIPPVALRMS